MATSAASPWGTGSPLAPSKFVCFLACTQTSLNLRAIPTLQLLQLSGFWGSSLWHWLPEPGQDSW